MKYIAGVMMKKILLFVTLLAVAISCSDEKQNNIEGVTFNLATTTPIMRSGESLRYIVEIYNGDGALIDRGESSTGTLSLDLDKGTYTVICWADYNLGTYDTASLTGIAVVGEDITEAFLARKSITVTTGGDVSITLNRVVAQINLIQSADSSLTVGDDLAVSYKSYNRIVIDPTSSDESVALDNSSDYLTTIDADLTVGDATGTIATLCAVVGDSPLSSTLSVSVSDGKVIELYNVVTRGNWITNITGEYYQKDTVTYKFTFELEDIAGTFDSTTIE